MSLSKLENPTNSESELEEEEEEDEERSDFEQQQSNNFDIQEREDSIDINDPQVKNKQENEEDESQSQEVEGVEGTRTNLKRKLSPNSNNNNNNNNNFNTSSFMPTVPITSGRWGQAGRIDNSYVAAPPILLQHTAHLPESEFEFHTTRSHPINKNNFRYTPCGPSPTSSNLPITIQRIIESSPQSVRFSWEDRSSFVLITEDAKTITAEKGWRAARGNVGIREGNWYWEVKVERGGGEGGRTTGGEGEGSWVRPGVGRRESPLNAPIGIDGHSYAYRDRGGEAVTLARPVPYGQPFKSGQTIGIYISLPPRPTPSNPITDRKDPARIVRKRIPIRYKGQLYFESLEYTASKEMQDLSVDPATKMKEKVIEESKVAAPGTKSRPPVTDLTPLPRPLPILEQSKIAFFLDGVCQGVAFENIFDFLPLRLHPGQREKRKGTIQDAHLRNMENWHDDGNLGYFPLVSVFGGGIATLNPGPDFAFPPPNDIEKVLRESSKPPKTDEIIVEKKEIVEGVEGVDSNNKSWRPLSERYVEALGEQRKLDEQDEIAATKLFQRATLDQASGKIQLSDNNKKGKFSNTPQARLASLGVIMFKQEEVSSASALDSPLSGASPLPEKEKERVVKEKKVRVVKQVEIEERGGEEEESQQQQEQVVEDKHWDHQKAWRGTRSDGFV